MTMDLWLFWLIAAALTPKRMPENTANRPLEGNSPFHGSLPFFVRSMLPGLFERMPSGILDACMAHPQAAFPDVEGTARKAIPWQHGVYPVSGF
jgi:hypothetical protein